MRIIDMDTHFAPKDEFSQVPEDLRDRASHWVTDGLGRTALVAPGRPLTHLSGVFRPAERLPGNFDFEARLADMDAMGVEKQLLCQEFSQYCYEMEPKLAAEMARSSNMVVARALKSHPDRFLGSAVIPTQDIGASLEEAQRAIDLGFYALFMKGPQGGKNFDDMHFWPLYEFCSKQDIPISVHSTNQDPGSALPAERLSSPWGVWVGMMTDFFVNISALIYSGVFDAFPNLRFCFAESGATWLPWYVDRMKLTYDVDVSARQKTRKYPWEYLTSNVYVAVDATEQALGYVCDTLGSVNLLLGTDYPHGDITGRGSPVDTQVDRIRRTHIDLLLEREDITTEAKENIAYKNALKFFGGRVH